MLRLTLINYLIEISLLSIILISSCSSPPPEESSIDHDALLADESNTAEWLAYGRTHSERRFSPIEDINISTVSDLKVDWYIDLPGDIGLVSTPLVVDGILYFTGTMNIIRAVDATTGEMIWQYDPLVGKELKGKRQVGWVHNRGISYYDGKIFAATWDGRLFGLDAKTGNKIWETRTFDVDQALYITGTPKAFKGKVIIGNGGTENGPTRGFVTAYDANTGKEAWKFYIVPGNPADGFENEAMEMAAKTWTGEWWKHGGGGNVWHGFTYDPEFDAIYIGTGNGSPWNRKIRSPEGGDNLFLCSILALDANTGEYKWHYQTTPGETWDYNSNMDIVLADLEIEGKPVKAILHAPKNGFFYVINRETGKLISAEPIVETSWASHIDKETGRPVEIPGARYENSPALVTPGPWGAHTWHAMSFNPETGLAYIPVLHTTVSFNDFGYDLVNWQAEPFSGGTGVGLNSLQLQENPTELLAWNPVTQKAAWTIPQDRFWNAGTLTSAGNLVFQGRSDGYFKAYNASTGEELWSFNTGLGISAPPITYKIGGRQYVALLVGFGGGYSAFAGLNYEGWSYGTHMRRLVVFSLEGNATLPALPPPHYPKPLVSNEFSIDPDMAARGASVYYGNGCASCHGVDFATNGMAPDLRASTIPLTKESISAVVRDGLRTDRGMPRYAHISDDEINALMHFIRQRAHDARVIE